MIRVAVAGAAGRMGETVCAAVQGAPDMELVGRADPRLGVELSDLLAAGSGRTSGEQAAEGQASEGQASEGSSAGAGSAQTRPDVVVEFTRPDTALENILVCVRAGVHVVAGTTGFDIERLSAELNAPALRTPEGRPRANVLIAPNFAIGAVLMMRFAAQAAEHMAAAEIVELHHDQKLDAPSGTAKRTARLMAAARAASGGQDAAEPPIHSVRLPGLVAHQEVILGDVGQTLTIRHDTIGRDSFMPGVLLAVRRVGELTDSPTIGLEQLLF